MTIATNLGRIANCGQFFIYRLSEWDGKWRRKEPWGNGHPVSPSDPANWRSYEACAADVATREFTADVAWAVGLWITDALNMVFVDIDRLPDDYTLTTDATALLALFPGCMVEWSSSRRGVHILGTRTTTLRHSNKSADGTLELYTADRGIALANDAQGSIDTDCTAAFNVLVDQRFQPRAAGVATGVPVVASGPDLGAVSASLRVTERILTARDGERNHALNTAAYTLGGLVAAGRMTHADARAALVAAVERAEWGNMPLQLSKIDQGLRSGQEAPIALPALPIPGATVVAPTPTGDWHDLTDQAVNAINNSGTFKELTDNVMPWLASVSWGSPHYERIVATLKARFAVFNSPLTVAVIRSMLRPATTVVDPTTPPEWFAPFVYLKQRERFYNRLTGGEYSPDAFRMEYGRYMPIKGANGQRDDPVVYARDHWNIVTVEDAMYDPRQPDLFVFAGKQYVNSFRWSSLAPLTPPSEEANRCIQMFQQHLYEACSRRDALYFQLLWWIAHNIQKPGHKIRWAPLLKGVGGDGKSLFGELFFNVLGYTNTKITSIGNINNSGGFTDWAHGKAVNIIEEIRLEGKEKRKLYNAMKVIIGDQYNDINKKGKAASDTIPNTMNHWANTNYGDAIPPDDDDRRWCVVFTPWADADEAARVKGLRDADDLAPYFDTIGRSMRSEPGAWRSWLCSIDLTGFNPNARAPETDEKQSMKLMASDPLDQLVMDVLERGGIGITKDVFSSSCLMVQVRQIWGENPSSRGWNTLLTRLGYQQLPKTVWFRGTAHRIWSKYPIKPEYARKILPTC